MFAENDLNFDALIEAYFVPNNQSALHVLLSGGRGRFRGQGGKKKKKKKMHQTITNTKTRNATIHLNAGVIMVRNSKWSMQWTRRMYAYHNVRNRSFEDQGALRHWLLTNASDFETHAKLIHARYLQCIGVPHAHTWGGGCRRVMHDVHEGVGVGRHIRVMHAAGAGALKYLGIHDYLMQHTPKRHMDALTNLCPTCMRPRCVLPQESKSAFHGVPIQSCVVTDASNDNTNATGVTGAGSFRYRKTRTSKQFSNVWFRDQKQ